MDNTIRLRMFVNRVNCGNPADCAEEIKALLTPPEHECDIAVFSELAFTGSCGDAAQNPAVTSQCAQSLEDILGLSKDFDRYIIAGLMVDASGKTISAIAVIYKGTVVAYIPAGDDVPNAFDLGFLEGTVSSDTVFSCGGMRFCVLSCDLSSLVLKGAEIARTGCDLIIIPAYSPMYAGKFEEIRQAVLVLSKQTGCAVAVVNGGCGDTSSPWAYDGFLCAAESGRELAAIRSDGANGESFSAAVDLDIDIIRSQKKIHGCAAALHTTPRSNINRDAMLLNISKTPFLPAENTAAYLDDLFRLQAGSLASRMENIGIARLVLGVSGGLDSTAALLVSAAAVDALGLPRANIIAISMPGFGTSDRTYYNAMCLIERLGATKRDIPIRQSVTQHFEDIGHSGKKDTAYENAQARERAQILFDVANMVGGIVVGTGDLSEAALGFCTFAGDHIANYNVNSCVTKTVLRTLVRYIAENSLVGDISDTLLDILDTPVSPELLPAAENGEIEQKTEDILAPYELLDFFLYYFIKYRMRPLKIYEYACFAFKTDFESAYIKEKLKLFLQKFCAGQFKRACSPDSASITEVNLSNRGFYIPSDIDSSVFLKDLD